MQPAHRCPVGLAGGCGVSYPAPLGKRCVEQAEIPAQARALPAKLAKPVGARRPVVQQTLPWTMPVAAAG